MAWSLLKGGVPIAVLCSLLSHQPAEAKKPLEKQLPPPLAERHGQLKAQLMTLKKGEMDKAAAASLTRGAALLEQVGKSLAAKEKVQGERFYHRAELELMLAKEQLALAALKKRVASLGKRLAQLRNQVSGAKSTLAEREEYLNLIKVVRQ